MSEERFAKALAAANVPLRVRIMAFPMPGEADVWKEGGALKWILDGTPIEQGAALRTAKYRKGGQGKENFSDIAPQNILDADAQSLPETRSVLTIIDGKVAYEE